VQATKTCCVSWQVNPQTDEVEVPDSSQPNEATTTQGAKRYAATSNTEVSQEKGDTVTH